jgi:hypothetical protein
MRLFPWVLLVEKVPAIAKPFPILKTVTPSAFSGVIVRLAHLAFAVTVTVKCPVPDAVSKIALSEAVGTDAPEAPPEVADHFDVLFQLPELPTQ